MSVDAHTCFRVVGSGQHAVLDPACGTCVTFRVRRRHLSRLTSHTRCDARVAPAPAPAAERRPGKHAPSVDGAASAPSGRRRPRPLTVRGAL